MNQMDPTLNQILCSHATKKNLRASIPPYKQLLEGQKHSSTPCSNHTKPRTKIACQHIDNYIQRNLL